MLRHSVSIKILLGSHFLPKSGGIEVKCRVAELNIALRLATTAGKIFTLALLRHDRPLFIYYTRKYVLGLCTITNCCDINGHLNEHCSNNDLKCQNCSYLGRDFADMTAHR